MHEEKVETEKDRERERDRDGERGGLQLSRWGEREEAEGRVWRD